MISHQNEVLPVSINPPNVAFDSKVPTTPDFTKSSHIIAPLLDYVDSLHKNK